MFYIKEENIMKKISKILSIILAITMVISIIPITVSAATYSGTCGDSLTWTFDDETGTFTVSGTGAMYDYSFYNRPWQNYEDSIKKVVINNGVTTIGDRAFYHCSSLTTITFSDSVIIIGEDAFYACICLESIEIPDSVTTIGEDAFYACTSLKSITLPDSATTVSGTAFKNTAYYKNSSNWDNNVLYIGNHLITTKNAISGSYTIKEGTKIISDEAFYYWKSITSVTIPDSVTTIGKGAFDNCTSLTEFIVDSDSQYYSNDEYGVLFNKDKTTLIQYPIGNTRTIYTIPDSVTTIGDYAFVFCGSLTSITIPDSVTTIGMWAFASCSSLTSITIPDSVTKFGDSAFANSDKLTSVIIGNGVTEISNNAFWDCNSLASITIGDSVTTIGGYVFYYCYRLTSIIIPDSVTTIGDGAFYYCSGLESVTIGESVTTIGNCAFYECYNLTSITFPDSVTAINGAIFEGCSNLESVTIGAGVTTIDGAAFYDCYPTSITVSNNNKYYSSDEYGVLFNKDKTTLIKYPIGNERTYYTIPDSVTTIGASAFYGCNHLIDVTIPDSVTTIGDYAFGWCTNFVNITIPDSVTTIGDSAFASCSSLTSITIPDSVTTIGKSAFSWCSSLTSVIIPISVTKINESAFNQCSKLKNVYYEGTSEQWEKMTRFLTIFPGSNPTIHYNYHIHKYNTVVTAPACTEQGYTTYTCECGDTYVDDYVDAIGHSHTSKITTPATHLEDGVKTFTCACGDTYTETIDKITEHNHEAVVTPPTCTDRGLTTYTCECGNSYVDDYVDALGHTEETIPAVAPTCTETGFTEGAKCSVCGETLTEQKELPANGHIPANTVEENYVAPTCTENGNKDVVVYCSVCDEEISRETVTLDAIGHTDNDGDGYCDADNELLDPSVECECNCHKDGITNLFFKLILFFQRLFGSNKECSCGVIHY